MHSAPSPDLVMSVPVYTFAVKTGTMKTGHLSIISLLLVAVLPDAAVSCRPEEAPEHNSNLACSIPIHITRSGSFSLPYRGMDAFVYFADSTGRLDSYAHYDADECADFLQLNSTSGRRRAVVVANCPEGRIYYADILTYEGLKTVMCDLVDEDPSSPVMSGEMEFPTGPGKVRDMVLSPLMAKVKVRSLTVDFSGRPYRDAVLEHSRAYLVNVNGLCPLVPGDRITQGTIYNQGAFDRHGCAGLAFPEMLYCDDVTGHPMYCYPCTSVEEGALGRSPTRLVIEGSIRGETYYYPINIGEDGVGRGCSYTYDITVTRTGTTDPDIPATAEMVTVELCMDEWEEYDNENIYY